MRVFEAVGVLVRVGVFELVGVLVRDGVIEGVFVFEAVGVLVRVAELVGVFVRVGESVAVFVFEAVGVRVGVFVTVAVGVASGLILMSQPLARCSAIPKELAYASPDHKPSLSRKSKLKVLTAPESSASVDPGGPTSTQELGELGWSTPVS